MRLVHSSFDVAICSNFASKFSQEKIHVAVLFNRDFGFLLFSLFLFRF